MDNLYKYTSLKYIEESLNYGVHAARLNSVNDPYEIHEIMYPEDYRIVCMTSSCKKMLLWSYYVNHKGCCIEFDIPEFAREIVKPVNYSKNIEYRQSMDADQIIASLYSKGDEWKEESEYRAVYYTRRDNDWSYWKKYKDEIFLKLEVKAIILGVNSEYSDGYLEALKSIRDWNDNNGKSIPVYKMYKRTDKYGLEINKQFDYKREIKKLQSW